MLYLTRAPGPPLDRFVESIWVWKTDPSPFALERVLPRANAQLIVNLKDEGMRQYDAEGRDRGQSGPAAVVCGARSRYSVIDTAAQEHVMGVVFTPSGLAPFVDVPAFEIHDAEIPLDSVWPPRRVARLREQLAAVRIEDTLDVMERTLIDALTSRLAHPAVAFALATFHRAPERSQVGVVTAAIGLSAKRFIERFKRDVGMTPKRYCRLLRFQHAVAQAHRGVEVNWMALALDAGYFDQPHFIHDFRAFSGLTPTEYHARRTAFQNHVSI